MISYTPKSKYSWFLYLNGQLFADITGIAEERTFSQARNEADSMGFSVSLDKLIELAGKLQIDVADILQAAYTEVRVYRYGIPLVAGEIGPWNTNIGSDRKIPVKTIGWFDLFKARRTSQVFVGSNSALTILQSLISTTLGKTYGTAGNFNGLQIGAIPAADSTTLYTDVVYDNKTIYDAITEMANETNGFDIEVTWDKKINVYYPRIGSVRDDIVFTYPHGNTKDIQLSVDPTKMFNSLLARGQGSGANKLTVPASNILAQQKYGLREDVLDYSAISDTTLLQNSANADQNIYKEPLVIHKVLFDGSGSVNAPQVGSFHIGDLVKIYVANGGVYPSITKSYMIDRIDVKIGDKDEEDVEVTLANPTLPSQGS